MDDRLEERAGKLREAFKLAPDAQLLAPDAAMPEMSSQATTQLSYFNMEWHIIPSEDVVPFDDAYLARFYPMAPRGFNEPHEHAPSYREQLVNGHRKHQGQVIAIESIQKPRYLPGNRQFYGTPYGFDASIDPFAFYMGRAGMTNATRFNHNYLSLRAFLSVVNEDWRTRNLLPKGYRLTICPPAVFNLIGAIFHTQWSETETLELGFYRDEQGNATCYAVGSNQPGDFSYINEVELETDWTLLGFRTALVPE
ncbi:MAG TPA: hypothetical protein VGN95_09855 [Pyrinomonadaceae bacterium]|jgi:hypothetical protein|nr:hypothetical protein [Pyrinomonadaceae bacterium]